VNKPHVTKPSAAHEHRFDLRICLLPRPGGQGGAGSNPAARLVGVIFEYRYAVTEPNREPFRLNIAI
jgi:hypothetical protein